jgi:CDP-glucose 4,6-dehydratase
MLAQRLSAEDGKGAAEGWNFGPSPEDTRPVEWIVEKIVQDWGETASWERDPVPGPHEAHFLSLDCHKANRELGWRPAWSIGRAIEKIIDWHRDYLAGEQMRCVTLRQINEYRKDAALEV